MKAIPNYEGLYDIDEYGNVFSHIRKRLLKPALNRKGSRGRYFVVLCKDGKKYPKYIHKLVAETYLNHVPNGYNEVIDHIDNNYDNNHVSNLQITTARHNTSKDRKNKTSKYTGVSWNTRKGKWVAQINFKFKKVYIGAFNCEEEAYKAYLTKLNENV